MPGTPPPAMLVVISAVMLPFKAPPKMSPFIAPESAPSPAPISIGFMMFELDEDPELEFTVPLLPVSCQVNDSEESKLL